HESGNAYKVRLLLTQLDCEFERVHLDILTGETRTKDFEAKNLNQRVPVLELADGRCLAESNAILLYLAENTPLLPKDPYERALAIQWMFFEQYSHEPYIAVVRFWHFSQTLDQHTDELDAKVQRGYEALDVMERHLEGREFFAGKQYSTADIALFAYTHVAHEGKFDLAPYDNINAWLTRVAEQPGHIGIEEPAGTLVCA
ncbi:MAG: glutathione S-transferase, partial [Myxococcota bacterium]